MQIIYRDTAIFKFIDVVAAGSPMVDVAKLIFSLDTVTSWLRAEHKDAPPFWYRFCKLANTHLAHTYFSRLS